MTLRDSFEGMLMFHGTLQLTKQTLTTEGRRLGSHAIRFGLMVILYLALCCANRSSWKNAAGLPLFQSQLLITSFFLSATAVFGFSQTITEEKEEETLGLVRLTDISPLAIILGKTVGVLCEALLLVAVQFPFAMIAITLGGISWAQVYAGYVALLAYLWLLASIGVTMSVCRSTGGSAARWTAIVVAVYALPPFLARFSTLSQWKAVCDAFRPISLPVRLWEVTESGFQDSAWGSAVWFGVIAGFLCLLFSWWRFDSLAMSESAGVLDRSLRGPRRHSRRTWTRPIIWREYVYSMGGPLWIIARIGVQFAIFFFVSRAFPRDELGFTCAWSALISGLFGILDGTWSASRLFQDEIRSKTWSALVQTPHPLPQIALDKVYGWALGLAPTIVSPFLFIIAMLIFHKHIPRELMVHVELFVGTLTIGLSVFGYLHLLVFLSLYFGWKGTPMTLTLCFAAGWIYINTVFTSRLGIGARCGLFALTSVALIAFMLISQRWILRRLANLAETA